MPISPAELLDKLLNKQYDKETVEKIKSGCKANRLLTFRVNTLKSSSDYIASKLDSIGIHYEKPDWYQDAFILPSNSKNIIQGLDIYEKGEIYLQSLSSMVPPLLVNPRENECILDMAAAPGGKTTQMAAISGGKAQITACEKNKIRAERLKYNLIKQGASRVTVMTQDSTKLDPLFAFDKILLDAPCSGSGTIVLKDICPDSGDYNYNHIDNSRYNNDYFSEELLARSVHTQEAMLLKALSLLKAGHEMIYSTCSILEEENEALVMRVISKFKGKAQIIPIEHPLMKSVPLLPTKLNGTCLICPTERYEGFFAAKIIKTA